MSARTMQFVRNEVALEVRADELPKGIAGRITGIALRYDVVDTYDTTFARGCLKRSMEERVAARKVPLLMDHERTTGAHVGVVAAMQDIDSGVMMTAEVFDTPEGRACMEYVRAVIAAGASTGLSIGFVPMKADMVTMDGRMVQRFTEVALREVSVTPMPSVPGTEITGARHDAPVGEAADTADAGRDSERSDADLLLIAARVALAGLPVEVRASLWSEFGMTTEAPVAARADAALPAIPTCGHGVRQVTMDERLAAVRATYTGEAV